MHAAWLHGLVVLVIALAGGASVSVPGVLFLLVLFSPAYVAYRRGRLSFPLVFACFFLPAWPWAAYRAFRRAPLGPPASVSVSAADTGVTSL
jgi:hypothetical protein